MPALGDFVVVTVSLIDLLN